MKAKVRQLRIECLRETRKERVGTYVLLAKPGHPSSAFLDSDNSHRPVLPCQPPSSIAMPTSPIITVPQSAGLGQTSKLSPDQLALLVDAWERRILSAEGIEVQPWKLDNTGAVKNKTVPWSKYCEDLQDGDYHQNVNTKEFGVRLLVIANCVPDELPDRDEAWTMAVNYASSEDILYGGKDSASWMHVDTPIPMRTRITVRITATATYRSTPAKCHLLYPNFANTLPGNKWK